MISTKSFKDLHVWRDAIDLTIEVYGLVRNLKDYGFKDQLTRACVSISNNIAEGYNRGSQKEFIRFYRLGYFNDQEIESRFIQLSIRILRLIQSLNTKKPG
jgi:four helix bundle protein